MSSPLLWHIVVDDLLKDLNTEIIKTLGYFDDIIIVIAVSISVPAVMQHALRLVKKWCSRVGLSVNPGNTKLVAFTRKKNLDLNNVYISYTPWVKLNV